MREGIHPEYYQATVTCNCGNTFVTGSTKPEIHVEVCSKCHSFYTGQQKAAQARGRIDKFNRKYGVVNKEVLYKKVEVHTSTFFLITKTKRFSKIVQTQSKEIPVSSGGMQRAHSSGPMEYERVS